MRSFVRRSGRITAGQRRALDTLWPRWGLSPPVGHLDLDAIFGRKGARTLEIGFGDGEVLLAMAAASPEEDFIGVEVHEPGIGHCLLGIESRGLGNLRLIRADALEVLESWLEPASLDRINLFFPDPWPKKRHHKRRLVQPPFLAMASRCLKAGGVLHIATDWPPYAEQIAALLEADTNFDALASPAHRPATKFQRRGARLGHPIRDICCRRK